MLAELMQLCTVNKLSQTLTLYVYSHTQSFCCDTQAVGMEVGGFGPRHVPGSVDTGLDVSAHARPPSLHQHRWS